MAVCVCHKCLLLLNASKVMVKRKVKCDHLFLSTSERSCNLWRKVTFLCAICCINVPTNAVKHCYIEIATKMWKKQTELLVID